VRDFEPRRLPKLEDFPVEERTSAVRLLLEICHSQQQQLQLQSEQLALQAEQIQSLKDEVAILKGEKARPKIKSSNLDKDKDDQNGTGGGGGKRGKPVEKKTRKLEIHDEVIIQPPNIPEGSEFKGYEEYIVQDIEIKPKNTRYKKARYKTPDGKDIVGKLPIELQGSHFGPILKGYILSQYHQQHVTQNLILRQLLELGVRISEGQLDSILTKGHEEFQAEKEEVLETGLEVSSYVGVDDTGARHKGKNGFCTRIGNEFFTWFSSTESKSRINFLELLRATHKDYVINDVARQYMTEYKLAKPLLELMSKDQTLQDAISWEAHLDSVGIISERHRRIITEAALVASLTKHGIASELVIMSDDAPQFAISGFLNSLCWVHAERNIKKIIPYSDNNREAQKLVLDQLWTFYRKLKSYKLSPSEAQKLILRAEFDQIFKQKTCFHTLNLALGALYKNKAQLLLVLDRSDVPLHNNLSENDIRDYVKRRKISSTTRSDKGRESRDCFLSLKKTCQKLGISFWDYLQDRLSHSHKIPKLSLLIRKFAQAP
jgi:Transposase IS66 family